MNYAKQVIFADTSRTIRDWTSRRNRWNRGMKVDPQELHVRAGGHTDLGFSRVSSCSVLKIHPPKRNVAVWCLTFSLAPGKYRKMDDFGIKFAYMFQEPPCETGSKPWVFRSRSSVWGHSLGVDRAWGTCFWPWLVCWRRVKWGIPSCCCKLVPSSWTLIWCK